MNQSNLQVYFKDSKVFKTSKIEIVTGVIIRFNVAIY
jgi:hypothetical protein